MDDLDCRTHHPPKKKDQATSLSASESRLINILFRRDIDPVVELLARSLAVVDFVNLGRICSDAYHTLLRPDRQVSLRRFTLRCNGEVAERRRATSVLPLLQGSACEDDGREHSMANLWQRCLVPVCNVSGPVDCRWYRS